MRQKEEDIQKDVDLADNSRKAGGTEAPRERLQNGACKGTGEAATVNDERTPHRLQPSEGKILGAERKPDHPLSRNLSRNGNACTRASFLDEDCHYSGKPMRTDVTNCYLQVCGIGSKQRLTYGRRISVAVE